ncbi:MAG: hypothetical protein ABI091_13210 [Ferruginibacter sp.]
MKVAITQQIIRKSLATISVYLVVIPLIYLFNKENPSGPCTIGFGMLGYICLVVVSGICFFANLFATIVDDRSNIVVTLIHLIVVLGILFFSW